MKAKKQVVTKLSDKQIKMLDLKMRIFEDLSSYVGKVYGFNPLPEGWLESKQSARDCKIKFYETSPNGIEDDIEYKGKFKSFSDEEKEVIENISDELQNIANRFYAPLYDALEKNRTYKNLIPSCRIDKLEERKKRKPSKIPTKIVITV
jgi:hypothetical protein